MFFLAYQSERKCCIVFEKLSGAIRSWLGKDNAKPEAKSESVKKSVSRRRPASPAKDGSKNQAGSGNRSRSRAKKNKQVPAAAANDSSAAVFRPAVKVIPPHDEQLRGIPPAEGKTRFTDFPLDTELQFNIQKLGFDYCTPIQALTLPQLLEGRDLAGKAQTGTGKTAAFLITLFDKFLKNPAPKDRKPGQPRALILAPTRELAMQIHKDAESLNTYTDMRCVVVFGGMDHEKQRRELAQPLDVLIGTPGRVIDYFRSGSVDLSKAEALVIDEADRMLDMGFIPDVKRIVAQLPRKGERQTMLFSATLEDKILRLASGWLADPAVVESEPETPVSANIEQTFYSVMRDDKLALLLYLLRTMQYERVLIFGNRKNINLRLQHDLARFGYKVPVLSGDISQDRRIKILEKFRAGLEPVVIATDVAARGIHVDDVSLVINYDLPEHAEDYIHRIGRTGRAGHSGKAVSFLCEYGAYFLPDIEKLLGITFPSRLPDEEMLKLPEPGCANLPETNAKNRTRPPRTGGRRRPRH